MGSEQHRFPEQERRKRWGGCWGALSCFGTQKGGKRIVPASRIPEGNAPAAQPNGPQATGLTNQATALAPSLLAPPSSPASFTNSALPSTAQSPSCFLSVSANSPGGPSSTMFATGPYAHETQLVSPPVFSTFTTEPSTAPLTPPPELAHLTTPSSPDVPFAQFLTSSSFPERDFPPHWDPSVSPQNGRPWNGSGRTFGYEKTGASIASQDSNFFCPETFAQFYLDNPPFPNTGGRLSVSKDSDVHPVGGHGYQNRHNKTPKQDVEEIEAYRASFGFSADEIITTTQYVEISDVVEDSFTMTPFGSNKLSTQESIQHAAMDDMLKAQNHTSLQLQPDIVEKDACGEVEVLCSGNKDRMSQWQPGSVSGSITPRNYSMAEDDIFSKMGSSKMSRKYQLGSSCSDAEIDYRRGRRLRGGKGDFTWHD